MTPYTQTPGPWAIDWTLSGDAYWIEAKPGDAPIIVARVNNQQDANIVAAAPELLAALELITNGCTRVIGQDSTGQDMVKIRAAAIEKARAAIAKATGKKA